MEINKNKQILGSSSITLDSLRIYAALIVLLFHVIDHWFSAKAVTYKIVDLAHSAVIIFFVLSGYLIAYTTTTNNRGISKYMQSRFSRLYSIVIPSLIITAICEIVVGYYSNELHTVFTRNPSWPRYIISGLFLNEIWFFSSAPPINSPLWSLGYEFWYYVIFGLWFYRKKGYKALLLPLLACLFAGPKIIILMPIWLIGYLAYKLPCPIIKNGYKWMLMFFSFFISILLMVFYSGFPFKLGSGPLFFASEFVSDWITGLFVGFGIWIMPQGTSYKTSLFNKPIRKIADLTFAVYLLHYPLMILWDSIFFNKIKVVTQLWEPLLAVLIIAVLIGLILERMRNLWSSLFSFIFSKIKLNKFFFSNKWLNSQKT